MRNSVPIDRIGIKLDTLPRQIVLKTDMLIVDRVQLILQIAQFIPQSCLLSFTLPRHVDRCKFCADTLFQFVDSGI